MKRLVLAVTVMLAGCVGGSPVDPSLCTVQSDSLVVVVDPHTLASCPTGAPVVEVHR